ncbi:MAG: membrane lipoprotein lipid attachment site-containing protein [Defluviitaleaceae bacterium]|nr:membrane lipoprotein lipid attachment site-containing protein [Defluviitaleaceae bacterium]
MKKIVIFIIAMFVLTGCNSQSDYVEGFYPIFYETENLKETVSIYTLANEAGDLEITCVESKHSWAEAYFNALNDTFPSMILLVDIDFDGVPEILFVAQGSATNMWIDSGLSYQSGRVIDIMFYDEWGGMPTELSLLRNRLTDEMVWLAHGRFSSGAGVYQSWLYDFVDFSDFSQVQSTQILSYSSEMILSEEGTYGIGSIYSLHLSDDEAIEVPFEEIEAQRMRILENFEIIDVKILLIHSSQVFDNDTNWQDRTLNREKLISFFNKWETCV